MTDPYEAAALLECAAPDYDDVRPLLASAMRMGARACRDYQGQREQIAKLLALLGVSCLKAAIAKLEVTA